MKSILRWAGSKRQLLSQLRQYWPGANTRYIEPFAGSACLFFALEPVDAVLGDTNQGLIRCYRAIRSNVERVLECVRRLPPGKAAYYRIRAIDPADLAEAEQAARFIYLNRFCFNGIYRTNNAGRFNVPYGAKTPRRTADEDLLRSAARLLQRAQFVASDFSQTLAQALAGDFVYIDPPYRVASRRVFSEYQAKQFAQEDLDRLSASLDALDERKVGFVVSYADCIEGRRLLGRWNWRRVRVRRNVAGFSGHRKYSYELLGTNMTLGDSNGCRHG